MAKQILIEGTIDSNTTTRVRRELASANGQPIEVRIFSEGGDVIPGFTIHQMISEYRGVKSCVVDAAFSIASFIASAFPRCEMIENGYFMMHDPYWEGAESPTEKGFLESLRHKMIAGYSRRSGKPASKIAQMMRDETFMDAASAIAMGFVDAVLPAAPRLSISAKYRTAIAARATNITAKAQWDNQVQAKKAMGMTSDRAVLAVNRENPGLRQRMVDEANGRTPAPSIAKQPMPSALASNVVSNYPIGQFQQARSSRIERLVDRVINQAILDDQRR